jgi:MFS family permease
MADTAEPTLVTTPTGEGKDVRAAVGGAFGGFFVDMFDVYLPIVALAPAQAYFQATGVSATTAAVISAMIFVATLIGRPIGAALFGHFSDKLGRRRTAVVSVSGFGVVTLLIAMLPGYQQIGITAVVLLVVLRFIDGVFLGGEYTAASPLAMESSPKGRRGYYGGLIMSGFPLAYVAISLLTLAVLQFAPAGGLDSPYVQWGWRIPFAMGALMAFGFAYWYARTVPESPAWEQSRERTKAPLLQLFRGTNLRNFGQVFVMMTGVWLTLDMISAVLPGALKNTVGLSANQTTVILLIANVVLVGGYLGAGVLSQRIGRRQVFVISGVLTATATAVVYGLVIGLAVRSFPLALLGVVAMNLLAISCWGVVTTYINERFHTGVRSSGFGLGYSLAVVLPAFYAFYQSGLSAWLPLEYTPMVLLVIGGVLTTAGALWGPETKDVDMAAGAGGER